MTANGVTETAIAEVLSLAEATPQRLTALTDGFDDLRLAQSLAPNEWSPLQSLNHLRACDEVWMHSVHTMLAFENPRLQEIHPRQWIKTQNPYTNQSFSIGLQIFALRRQALLITLRSLLLSDWAREGRVAQKIHTIYSRVLGMANHEHEHCTQIETLLKGA